MSYPWYQIVNESSEIRQGDLISNCPIVIPPSEFGNVTSSDYDIEVNSLNTVVISQSCDLILEKLEIVLVCPYLTLNDFFGQLRESERQGKARKKNLERLKQGNFPAYHLLNRDTESGLSDFLVVDFRNVYGVNFAFLKTFARSIKVRHRLLPPYREHLSQAFARFFMRVGLPNDITDLN